MDLHAPGSSSGSIHDQLLADRKNLLDLGTRNRLINIPLRAKSIRAVEIVDEISVEVYSMLVGGKGMTFLPGRSLTAEEKAELEQDDDLVGAIPQPDETDTDGRGIARRHSDNRLQTRLTSEGLQKRLLDIWYDSRTLEEEQGVNVLYLAIGLLKWFEDDKSDVERHAPLVLLPVKLERSSAAERFTLRSRGETPSTNLSLQAKLNAEFGIKLPDMPDDDEIDISSYIDLVASTVSGKARWTVLPDAMVLGFFSFAKFLMYRDLDPDNWPAHGRLDDHPVIRGLLRDGFPHRDPIVSDTGRIDDLIPPEKIAHVVEADSSQSVVVEEIGQGHHLVVKGPPGTGKSQTITNIIAAAAQQGKKVLFVAEKMAALDVVHRRLRDVGLGGLTLELHSNKANKRAVLEELKKTKDLAPRGAVGDQTIIARLREAQDTLNVHADLMHERRAPSAMSPYRLIGNLVRARAGSGVSGYRLDGALGWNEDDVRRRREVCDEIVDRLQAIGVPAEHAWFGVMREPLLPEEAERLHTMVAALAHDLRAALTGVNQLAAILRCPAPTTLREAADVILLARATLAFPGDRAAVANSAWQHKASLTELVELGKRLTELRDAVDQRFAESVWESSLADARNAIAAHGGSFFRFLNGSYRSAITIVKSYAKGPLPKSQSDRLDMIDMVMSAQKARRKIEAETSLGRDAFGARWSGERSAWNLLSSVMGWADSFERVLSDENRARVSSSGATSELAALAKSASESLQGSASTWDKLTQFLQLDQVLAIDADRLLAASVEAVTRRVAAWETRHESVSKWISFRERCDYATELGLGSLSAALMTGRLSGSNLGATFERCYFEALRDDFFDKMPSLKRFDGELHSRTVDRFRELDRARLSVSRERIVGQHLAGMPRGNGGVGPLGVLNAEFAKKKNHLPIRKLLERAGPAIQQIKPIMMMSPLSVAQFLRPGAIEFDLLVVDEASQVEPVDALGAVARCKQVVIVGDERQLPPTRFFAKLTSDIEENEDEEDVTLRARDAESILDLCLAKGMSDRMLRWHYRSKHQSLIAVSNREFYDNRLFIIPSPFDAVAGMGLKFKYLPNAHYDRGNTRTNPAEAKAVAEAVIRHARQTPTQSLGVATFSVAQRQAVVKELELLRREHPDVEDFFNRASTEPFFVKNLENIQGDERDVIFISVGYGRTATGFISMSFGPLNSEGGERRLNVLISRAKLRCEVFSSITGDDIDLERVRSRGVVAFKLFLTFAQTGKFGISEPTGNEADSVFEEEVAHRLRSLGHDVKHQIGSAGFFVDLAVSDPEKPGRFVLGIECDGAQYHSSRSARDRDRLRQRVLEDHGWVIHRIWSTDWYLRPQEELEKVSTAIEAAKSVWQSRDLELAQPKQSVPVHFTIEHDQEGEVLAAHAMAEPVEMAVPYREASLTVALDREPHEVNPLQMSRYVTEVVKVEGPVHESEIVTRVRSAWGLARSGNRIRDAVVAGINMAINSGAIKADGEFYSIPNADVVIRDRSGVLSLGLRKPEYLPPAEIEKANIAVIDENFGATRLQLATAVSRLFGWQSTSAQLKMAIDLVVDKQVADGVFVERNELIQRKPT
jgi:very-short-patch-repair endonuclease